MSHYFKLVYGSFFKLVYEGEEEVSEAVKKAEEERKRAEKTFNQDQVNKLLAEDRRKHDERYNKLAQQLAQIQESQNLTAKEKEALATQIEELQNASLTKEQLLQKETEKLKNESIKRQKQLEEEGSFWKNQYTQSSIINAITNAAVKHEAVHPQQIISVLGPMTRIVEIIGEDGKPTKQFTPKAKVQDIDKAGNPVILDLDVDSAVKWMKEKVDQYGNLFKAHLNGGVGGSGNDRTSNKKTGWYSGMSMDDFKKWREKEGG